MYRKIDCMTWPCPGVELSGVEWRIRHSTPSRSDMMVAASVMAAYRQMIEDPAHKRQMIVRELRQGPNLTQQRSEPDVRASALDPLVGREDAEAMRFLAMQFADLFEGLGMSDVARVQDALRRARQIMVNMTPLLSQLGQQVPTYTANSLPHGWMPPNEPTQGRP